MALQPSWNLLMPRLHARIGFFLTALLTTSACTAEPDTHPHEGPDDPVSSYSWGVGLVGISQQQAYTDIDRNNLAIPMVYFDNRWVELMGPWLDLKLPEFNVGQDQRLRLALRTQLFGFDGYKAKDAPTLEGMDQRKAGIFAGPSFRWTTPIADVFGEWMFDTSGNSNGQRVSIGLERQFQIGERLMLTPSITAMWLDHQYADYYYGVRSDEARAGRSAYSIEDSVVNTEFSLRADYFFNQHQAMFVQLGYTLLGDAIQDSPLTDGSGESMLLVGYLYRIR